MLVYPSGIDVSTSTLRYLSACLRARRREYGTRWRRVSVGRQALLVLAHLRSGHTYAQLTAGFGVGTTTALPVHRRGHRGAGRPRPDPRRSDEDRLHY